MKLHHFAWYAVAILIVLCPLSKIVSADSVSDAVYDDNNYRNTFKDFYERLGPSLPGDVLLDVMEEQIETALMRGRNIAPVDLQPKIRQVKLAVHKKLKRKLCPSQTGQWSKANIERAGLDSVTATLSGYRKHNDDYARIVSVLVRILENAQDQFCKSTEFRDLAP